MSRGINKAIIIGYLGGDPEHRVTPSGVELTTISVATTSYKKQKEITQWHRVVLFGHEASFVNNYLKKGSQVYIEGEIEYQEWTDAKGVKRYSTQIKANKLQSLGSRGGATDSNGDVPAGIQGTDGGQPSPQAAPCIDDEIPF